jgi:dCMP deaminase
MTASVSDTAKLAECDELAKQSPDPNTRVGCVIVGVDGTTRSQGCNTFPDRIRMLPSRLLPPEKYSWIEHAERNAIYRAAQLGIALAACTLYVGHFPCISCARAIIQVGIREVVIGAKSAEAYEGSEYREEQKVAREILREAGISVRQV